VNVASAAGLAGIEREAAYCASKFAVVGFSETLRAELADLGIGVTVACPGVIDTPLPRSARLRGSAGSPGLREAMIAVHQQRGYSPERVAENVLRAIQRNRAIAPISPEAWILHYGRRFAPHLVERHFRRAAARHRRAHPPQPSV
jgi:short-subunit dehydrogenase